jgi:ABC-2 type transport system ATP-binding protein
MGSISLVATNVNCSPPVLVADRLNKTYLGISAVRDISFSISAGQIFGYLGPNGSGKSTTVKMLTGLLQPTTGRVLFRGENIQEDPLRYKSQLGYVPDEPYLYGFLTGWEYLGFITSLRGINDRQFQARARPLLQQFGLEGDRHTRLSGYSKGMRQRVALISALLHDPDVLVLDEPFSGLDVTTSLIVREVLKMLAERGKAIFFSSPSVESFEQVCTHVLLLRKGVQIAYGTVAEIASQATSGTLESAFMDFAGEVDARRIAGEIVSTIVAR